MRQIVVLIAILMLGLIFNSILPKQDAAPLDRLTVEKFVLEDAKVTYGESAIYAIVKTEELNGKWNIELDITKSYTSSPGTGQMCQTTFRRYYNLFPIVFREELYANTC